MPELTKEDKESFQEKLDYLGLDLENIPEELKDFNPIEYRSSKRFDNTEYKVYRYIPIEKIQIMITDTNRLTDIKEKYDRAKPIFEYLQAENEEQIENFAMFLNLLKNTEIEEIEEISEKQDILNNSIPYDIRYEKNYIWQIYYSEYTDTYFMLAPSKESEIGALFYILKEQIKKDKQYIYAPITNFEPGEDILTKTSRTDIENYLWLFTKQWPKIYEIMLKDETKKIVIVGETEVYPSVFAKYHIELKVKEEADDFYRQLKALFILQTELKDYYSFNVQIDDEGNLEFYNKGYKVDYQNLPTFITNEYIETNKNIKKMQKKKRELSTKLDELKSESKQKENEFLEKQKEISTYLEYKKTFLGKVKYYFARKKKSNKFEISVQATIEKTENELFFEEKNNYNIEDLVTIYSTYSKIEEDIKNKELDINALKLKIENLSKKIENASMYINEINSHKKSIFEFWKYSSKDDSLALNPGEEEENPNMQNALRKVFDYESDREEITKQIDKLQRENLSKDETDFIFAINSPILPIINKIKAMIKVPDEKISELLEQLKTNVTQEKTFNVTEYDIFGSLLEDKTKIKNLGKNKHRETEKNKYQILGINNSTTLTSFKTMLINAEQTVSTAIDKCKTIIDMPIYKVNPLDEKIDLYSYDIYSMNVEDELTKANIENNECNLIKLNIQEDMPAIFYTNIMFFDNYNKTLPLGMDKSDNVLINSDKLTYTLKDKRTVITNKYFTKEVDSSKLVSKRIHIYEYDVELKKEQK